MGICTCAADEAGWRPAALFPLAAACTMAVADIVTRRIRADVGAPAIVATNVVALSLTRGAPGNICGVAQGTEKDGARIMQFVNLFGGNGLLGDICAASFGPFFDQAVGLISSACGDFTPPG